MMHIEIKIKRGSLTLVSSPDGEFHLESDPPCPVLNKGHEVIVDAERVSGSVRMTCQIPESAALDASLGRGPLEADGLSVERGDLNVGLGNAHLTALQRGHWDVNVGKGDLRVEKAQGSFDLNVGMGTCELSQVSGSVDLNDGLGRISLEECEGHYDINAGKGDVTWTHGGGELDINAGMGNVTISGARGAKLDVNAGLGKVTLANGVWGTADVSVGVGDVSAEGRFDHLTVQVKNRGRIEFAFPFDVGARIEASTEHGRVISHLPLIPVGHAGPQRGERLVGVVGDGRSQIELETRRGNIVVGQTPGEQHPDSAPPDLEGQRRTILAALQAGEITVEEADALLEQLDHSV
ncbi:DUF4097 family beta strand repeat-containing protein [Sulfobacillus harzensis]|uniref:DUF4097 family beta strand repeat protein n=1 Tax=Sulfobacillus harzensis TaxID=2729629 RepID=A0A7Y0L5Y3_9FIRM|nr:DUF4097 family beta strand repeat-containing protein [Sulfobacillus harzensis]NMP23351.1 DUF4097 family beta strand repeat protein [Sulfobacillus harzensis]